MTEPTMALLEHGKLAFRTMFELTGKIEGAWMQRPGNQLSPWVDFNDLPTLRSSDEQL